MFIDSTYSEDEADIMKELAELDKQDEARSTDEIIERMKALNIPSSPIEAVKVAVP